MKIKNLFIVILLVSLIKVSAQTGTDVTPKKNWFFGIETGLNTITSFELDDSKNSLQGGFLAEYYFAKQWSVSTKLKYFKIGVTFYHPENNGLFGTSTYSGNFKGEVIFIPLIIKWEFRIYKNFKGNLKLGTVFNAETKSDYSNYSSNLNPDEYMNKKIYIGVLAGYGLTYFFNNNSAIYFDLEVSFANIEKGYQQGLVSEGIKYPKNILFSIGYKYNFKK